MPYSEAQKRATLKYRDKACDRIEVVVKKGIKDIYKAHAATKGMSLNAYIIDLIEKDMEGEK